MLIEEIGIVCRGFILSRTKLHKEDGEMLEFKKGAFFSTINAYIKYLFSEDLFYIEATNHITFFSSTVIESYENKYYEDLI